MVSRLLLRKLLLPICKQILLLPLTCKQNAVVTVGSAAATPAAPVSLTATPPITGANAHATNIVAAQPPATTTVLKTGGKPIKVEAADPPRFTRVDLGN